MQAYWVNKAVAENRVLPPLVTNYKLLPIPEGFNIDQLKALRTVVIDQKLEKAALGWNPTIASGWDVAKEMTTKL